MKRYTLWLAALLLLTSCKTHDVVRSPKDAADQSGKRMALVPPMPKPAVRRMAIAPRPPKPFHLTLQWEKNPNAARYLVLKTGMYWQWPVNTNLTTTNNWLTISNLWKGSNYQFVVVALDSNWMGSDFSPPCYWPQPRTNYFALGVSDTPTNAWTTNTIVVADKDRMFYRLNKVGGAYQLLASTDLKTWSPPLTNWPATNSSLARPYLRQSKPWSNWDYAKPD